MNIIDTRDLVAELAELTDRAEDEDQTDPLDEDEIERVAALTELLNDLGNPKYGAKMIPEGDFEEYAQETAEELDLIPENAGWPANCIDWEQAASELTQDYSTVEFDGQRGNPPPACQGRSKPGHLPPRESNDDGHHRDSREHRDPRRHEVYTPESKDDADRTTPLGMTSMFNGHLLTPDDTERFAVALLRHARVAREAARIES